MSTQSLLPDSFDDAAVQAKQHGEKPMAESPENRLIEIARTSCDSSVVTHGEFISMPASQYEELAGRQAPRPNMLFEGEMEILRVLDCSDAGMSKESLAHATGLDSPHGQFGGWIKNLIAHGFIEAGGKGRGSKGYRITQDGRKSLQDHERRAE